MPKCDLHLYSCFSQPISWFARKAGLRLNHETPQQTYRRLEAYNFDFITFTDLNSIEGCLQIIDQPKAFISTKVSTCFPEDHCEIDLLLWNLTEAQYKELQPLRSNIYELCCYLNQQQIIHGVAHPLHSKEIHLNVDHLEKLILLFRIFEISITSSPPLETHVLKELLTSLTPQIIQTLAQRHQLEPVHSKAWEKSLIYASGSSGLYSPSRYVSVEKAPSISEFLKKIEQAEQTLSHLPASFTQNLLARKLRLAFKNINMRLPTEVAQDRRMRLVSRLIERIVEGRNPTNFSLQEKIGWAFEGLRNGIWLEWLGLRSPSFGAELASYFLSPQTARRFDELDADRIESTFEIISRLFKDLTALAAKRIFTAIHDKKYRQLLNSLPLATLPTALSLSYSLALNSGKPNNPLLQALDTRWRPYRTSSLFPPNNRRAWFTDTFEDLNGVARTIRTMAESSHRAQADLTIITCLSCLSPHNFKVRNFTPLFEFNLPEYESQKIALPPLVDIIDFVEREKFTECIISTPGPVGLAGLLAAKLLGLRISVIDHTDFPHYVRKLSADAQLEALTWKFLEWFYKQADRIWINSEFYRKRWMMRGFSSEKLDILPRGIDTKLFNPSRRQEDFWKQRDAQGTVLLYVGRISKEKELEFLAHIFEQLQTTHPNLSLALVGEGPFQEELQQKLPQAIFTGPLHGTELAIAYASADFFIFPSTTDTFGNAVLEALASGLTVFVSNIGGPQELITSVEDGKALPAGNLGAWVEALKQTFAHPIARDLKLQRVAALQQKWSWDSAFEKFWRIGST